MRSVKDPKESANNPADSDVEASESPPSGEQPRADTPMADTPTLAVRSDGKLLLSTTDLNDVDLSEREIWVGLVLSEAEASDIQERLNFEEAAAPTVARLIARDKKNKKPDTDDNDDE